MNNPADQGYRFRPRIDYASRTASGIRTELVAAEALIPSRRSHLTKVAQLHESDVLRENAFAPMPIALYRKYSPLRVTSWQQE